MQVTTNKRDMMYINDVDNLIKHLASKISNSLKSWSMLLNKQEPRLMRPEYEMF